MTSQEIAQALLHLDRLYPQKDSVRAWLGIGQSGTSQGDYDQAVSRLESANPGLRVRRVDLHYREGHVLAPED